MKHSLAIIVLLLCVVLPEACLISTEITVNKDGSAHVVTSTVSKPYMQTTKHVAAYQDTFFSCSEISQIKLVDDSINVAFDIRTLDSLGNYLYDGFTKDHFVFHYSNDTLTVAESDDIGIPRRHAYDCCLFVITIVSDRKIKSLHRGDSKVKRRGNNIEIHRKARHIKKGKKRASVMVVYE